MPDTAPEIVRLMLVDDHPFVRDGVRMRLEATGQIEVVGEAGSVDEAVQLARDFSADRAPHMVLTDISMRKLSGIDLAAHFRQQFPGIAVLVLSMHNNPEYVRRAIGWGARGYVLKDAPAQELVEAIQAVHAGETWFSPELRQHLEAAPEAEIAGSPLTPKELATLEWLACGYSNKQIALELGMSVRTVETHRFNLRRKLRIAGQAELVKYAIDHVGTLPRRGLAPG